MTLPEQPGSLPEIPDFGDGKDAGALRTIGEVAAALGIRQHVLRYWEEQFSSLRPLTRAGGRRYYRPSDVALILRIDRLLHHEGYTIKGAKQALRGKSAVSAGSAPVGASDTAEPGATNTASSIPLAEILGAIRERLAAAIED